MKTKLLFFILIAVQCFSNVQAMQVKKHDLPISSQGLTDLHYAIICKNYSKMESLLEGGANPDQRGVRQDNPCNPTFDYVHSLLPGQEHMYSICSDFAFDQAVPLHIAACQNDLQAILLLLNAHATVDVNDRNNRTPLWYAAPMYYQKDHLACISALMNAGADIEASDATSEKKSVYQQAKAPTQDLMEVIANRQYRQRACAFAAINHTRLGSASPFHKLPVYSIQQICSYLKPAV